MPYERDGIWYVDKKPRGYNERVARSTKQEGKTVARSMEAMLDQLGMSGRHEPLDALQAGRFDLPTLYGAYAAGEVDDLLRKEADPPLAEYTREWAERHEDDRYQYAVQRLLEVAPSGARLSWLRDPEHLRELIHHYEDEGYAPATEAREMAGINQLLRRAFGETVRAELVSRVRDARRSVSNDRTRWLTREEIRRVREEARKGGWWPPILLAIASGLRRSENVGKTGLRVQDVDLTPAESRGVVIVQRGKTSESRRRVPIYGEVVHVLDRWITEQGLSGVDPLFPDVSRDELSKAWVRIRKRAGVEDCTLHDLRHTYGVHLAQAGMHLVEIKERLGHSQIKETVRYAVYSPREESESYEQATENMGISAEGPTRDPTPDESRDQNPHEHGTNGNEEVQDACA